MKAASSAVPLISLLLGACADLSSSPEASGANMNRYVAMGTSISMGVASDGVTADSQRSAWPALLAADIGAEFSVPLIAPPGCTPPLVAPLAGLRRADNSLITDTGTCAPNAPGFTLPEQNVSVSGATALAAFGAPANSSVPLSLRVLPQGQTQLTAMRSMSPTFVSVELGAAELLPAMRGQLSAVTSTADFISGYGEIITALRATPAQGLLVLLPTDVRSFPAIRTSAEIASQRAAFAARNVAVSTDCDAGTNYVSLSGKLVPTLLLAAARASAGLGAAPLSCSDVAGTPDGILTSSDITALNAQVAQMNAFITNRATAAGYATFSLGSLYDTVKSGVAFDLSTMLTSATPFGALISLDGIHPSAAGQAVLASAAKAAILQKYGTITH